MIITRTPYRISFFGGGTDYPGSIREHGGAVLATAIERHAAIRERLNKLIHVPFDFEGSGSRVVLYQPNGL